MWAGQLGRLSRARQGSDYKGCVEQDSDVDGLGQRPRSAVLTRLTGSWAAGGLLAEMMAVPSEKCKFCRSCFNLTRVSLSSCVYRILYKQRNYSLSLVSGIFMGW